MGTEKKPVPANRYWPRRRQRFRFNLEVSTMKKWIFYILSVSLFSGCQPSPAIKDYLTLAPPENVSARVESDSLHIAWGTSRFQTQSDMRVLIYASRQSLMYASMTELPRPIRVLPSAAKKTIRIGKTELDPKGFIHLRVQTGKGDLSLPSLPELAYTFQ